MKKTILILSLTLTGSIMFGQNTTTPVQNPNTGSNINTTTNNSNSGVNPNGNPATIINSSANSNNANSTITNLNQQPATPYTPPVSTNTTVTTPVPPVHSAMPANSNPTPANDQWKSNQQVITTPVENDINKIKNEATITNPVAPDKSNAVEQSAYNVTANAGMNPVLYNRSSPIRKINADGTPRAIGFQYFAAVPVMSTYIPEIALNEIANRYGDAVYDITKVRQANDQYVYLVRIEENGIYRTEIVNATGL